MRFFLTLLPMGLLVLGILLGHISFKRAAIAIGVIALLVWVLLWLPLAFIASDHPALGFAVFMIAIQLGLAGWWIALIAGAVGPKPTEPAPAEKIREAYGRLDDDQKAKVKEWARRVVSFGAKHTSAHLRRKGRHTAADMVDDASTML